MPKLLCLIHTLFYPIIPKLRSRKFAGSGKGRLSGTD
jgi:hypothetical protein